MPPTVCRPVVIGIPPPNVMIRWIWAGTSALLFVAAPTGYLLARNLGGEAAAEGEIASAEHAPVATA